MSRLDTLRQLAEGFRSGGRSRGKNIFDEDIRKNGGPGGKEIKVFTAAQSDNFVKILLPSGPNDGFGKRVFIHYGLGPNEDRYLCPNQMRGTRCPACDLLAELKAAGLGQTEEGKTFLRSLNAWPERWLLYVINTKDDAGVALGPQVWVSPVTIVKEITAICFNTRTGAVVDPCDPESKKEICFQRTGTNQHNTKYLGFKLEDQPVWDPSWLEIPPYDDLIVMAKPEDIQASIEGMREAGLNLLHLGSGVALPPQAAPLAPRAASPAHVEHHPAPTEPPPAPVAASEPAPVIQTPSPTEPAAATPVSDVKDRVQARLAEIKARRASGG